jgi:hypothetical protein
MGDDQRRGSGGGHGLPVFRREPPADGGQGGFIRQPSTMAPGRVARTTLPDEADDGELGGEAAAASAAVREQVATPAVDEGEVFAWESPLSPRAPAAGGAPSGAQRAGVEPSAEVERARAFVAPSPEELVGVSARRDNEFSGNYQIAFEKTESGNYRIPDFRTSGARSSYRSLHGEGASPVVKQWKLLASILDALVRTFETGGPNTELIAQRLLAVWRDEPHVRLALATNGLLVGDLLAFEINTREGEWIQPAYLAGLRTVHLTGATTADDLHRMGHELSVLRLEADSVRRFADWLWSDGPGGLAVTTEMSYTDLFALIDLRTTPGIDAVIAGRSAAEALKPGAFAAAMASAAPEALEAYFQRPFLRYAESLQTGRLPLDDDQRRHLARLCDDPEQWLALESRAALDDARLARLLPPQRLAEGILADIGRGVGARLIGLVTRLHAAGDEHGQATLRLLGLETLGARLAQHLRPESEGIVQALTFMFRDMGPPVALDLVHGLLARADDDAGAFDVVCGIVRSVPVAKLRELIDPTRLTAETGGTLVFAMREAETEPAYLSALLAAAPPGPAVAMLRNMPAGSLTKLRVQVRDRLHNTSGHEQEELLRALVAAEDVDSLTLLGEAMLEGLATHWKRNLVVGAANAMARQGLGERFLLPLFRARKESTALRLCALDALRQDPAVLEQALRRRPGDLIDAPEVRKRLKELREALGHADQEDE